MKDCRIAVAASGVVTLGPDVTCDGFHRDCGVRVQTHVHLDHMHNFETSKGLQDIYLSDQTLQLLIAEFNADLSARINVNMIPLQFRETRKIKSSKVTLIPSDHMLGSVQVAVELADGMRVGYSGDFQWPLEETIKVDQLVLDSTYGSPNSIRRYSQDEAEEQLLRTAVERLQHGPLHIKAHRGTLHRGIQVLSEIAGCPIVASPRLLAEVEVYRSFGYPIGPVCLTKSPEGAIAIASARYIRCYGMGDQFPVQPKLGTTITLSAFMSNPDNPILEYSARALSVALSNHADFNGTLEYVRATGAKYVLTDNSRGGHAVELAQEITQRLGIRAAPSELAMSNEWGT
jgi:putative mRNA 3-end processing factor